MKALVLRKCTKARTSNVGRFQYPEKGHVEATDWDGKPKCGGGLHGLLWGSGYLNLDGYGELFQVIEVDTKDVVEFGGKCKFKCGDVLYTGNQQGAIDIIKKHPNYPKGNILNHDIQVDVQFAVGGDRSTLTGGYRSTLTGGDWSTLTGGYGSTLTGGDRSTLTGGDRSTLTGGDWSTLTGGYGSTLTGGDWSTLTGGDWSTLTGGYWSTLTGGDWSTLTGGYGSTLTGRDWSTLTGGYRSTLTGGDRSTLTGGINSVFICHWWNGNEWTTAVKKITKASAGKTYRLENGKFNLVND